MILRWLAVAAIVVAAPGLSQAGGFAVSENGSRLSGMGTAGAAMYGDPSAVFFNPANVSRSEGLQLNLGMTGLMPKWQYVGKDGAATSSETGIIPPPNFSATWQLGDVGIGELGAGLGLFVPYGSTFSWPADWEGREEIQQIGLSVFELSPVVSLRPHKMFAVGAGFRYLPSSVYMKKAVQFPGTKDGSVELGGSGSGVGASAGLSFWPMEGLSLALAWRSPVTLKMTGKSNFDFPAPFDTKAVDTDVRTEVPLAQVFRLGAAYEVLPKTLTVAADVEYQMWSAFKSLDITLVRPDGTEQLQSSLRNSTDSFVVHAGAEYRLTESFAVRGGYVWDQHTLPEDTVNPAPPDSDKHVVSLGASYRFGDFGLHGHFSNVFFADRTANTSAMPGEWSGAWAGGTMAYMFGLTLSANLDLGAPLGATASN